jgi:hypothetical protein
MYPTLMLPRPSGTEVSNLQAMSPLQGILVPPSENGITPAQPRWLDYPVTCFESVNNYIQILIDDLFRQAGQLGVTARATTGVKTQSGVSKSYDFHAQSFVLKESSKMAKCCELEMARIFKLYVVNEVFDYEARYEEDFGPDEDPDDDVKLYGDYIALEPGPKGKALAMKQLTHSVFDDADEEDVKEVIEEIEEELKNTLKDGQDIPKLTPEEQAAQDAIAAAAAASGQAPPAPSKKVDKKIPKRGYTIKKKKKI